jgi:simple sugar transport system permease protein
VAQRIKLFLLGNGPLLTTIVVFILAFLIGGWLYPAMKNPQVFFNLFINGGSLLLVSIGMTLVILTKGIDLSVGGVIALTTAASAALLRAGVSPFVVMPLMIVMGVGFGFTLGCIIQFLKVQLFIATLMGLFFSHAGWLTSLAWNPLPLGTVSTSFWHSLPSPFHFSMRTSIFLP